MFSFPRLFDMNYALLLWPQTPEEAERMFGLQCVRALETENAELLRNVSAAFAALGTELREAYDRNEVSVDYEKIGAEVAGQIAAIVPASEEQVVKLDLASYVADKVWPELRFRRVFWLFDKERFRSNVKRYLTFRAACEKGADTIAKKVKIAQRPMAYFAWDLWRACGIALSVVLAVGVHETLRPRFGWRNVLDTILDHALRLNVFLGVHLLYLVVTVAAPLLPTRLAPPMYFGLYQVESLVYGLFALRFLRDAARAASDVLLALARRRRRHHHRGQANADAAAAAAADPRRRGGNQDNGGADVQDDDVQDGDVQVVLPRREGWWDDVDVRAAARAFRDVGLALLVFVVRLAAGLLVGVGVGLAYSFLSRLFPKVLKPGLFEPSVNLAFLLHYLYVERRQIAEWRAALGGIPEALRRRVARRHVPMRQPRHGDVCPICLAEFDLDKPDDLDYCKWGCGQPVHRSCFQAWSRDFRNTCVFCQAWWG